MRGPQQGAPKQSYDTINMACTVVDQCAHGFKSRRVVFTLVRRSVESWFPRHLTFQV